MFLSSLTFRPDLFLKAKLWSFLWLAFLWLGQYLRNLCSVWKHLCLWGINNAGWHCFPYLRTQDFLTAGDRTILWAGWGSSRLNTLSAHRESGPWIDLEDNDAYILSGATGCGSRVTWYHWLMCRRTVSPGLGGSLPGKPQALILLSLLLTPPSFSQQGDGPATARSVLVNHPHPSPSFVQSLAVPWGMPEQRHCTDSIPHLPSWPWGRRGALWKQGGAAGPVRSHGKAAFLQDRNRDCFLGFLSNQV